MHYYAGKKQSENHVGPMAVHLDWSKQRIYGNASDVPTGAIITAPIGPDPIRTPQVSVLGRELY